MTAAETGPVVALSAVHALCAYFLGNRRFRSAASIQPLRNTSAPPGAGAPGEKYTTTSFVSSGAHQARLAAKATSNVTPAADHTTNAPGARHQL